MAVLKTEILERELTRKQFLQLLLGSSLMLFGLGNFLTLLKTISSKPASSTNLVDAEHGFGSRKFGV